MESKKDWNSIFEARKALWIHDGNPNRPYAQLTGKEVRISNVYFNGARVSHPEIMEGMVSELFTRAPYTLFSVALGKRADVVVGAALGSVNLIYAMAHHLWGFAWFTEPGETGQELKRFSREEGQNHCVAVEDTITTGKSVMETIVAAEKTGIEVLPFVLCIANRSGKKTLPDGRAIVSIIDIENARVWKEGENPFTPDGKERVPPVKPKSNWESLTRDYGGDS